MITDIEGAEADFRLLAQMIGDDQFVDDESIEVVLRDSGRTLGELQAAADLWAALRGDDDETIEAVAG